MSRRAQVTTYALLTGEMTTRLQSVRKKDQSSRQSVHPKSLLFSPSQKDIKASSCLLFYPESSKIHCSQPPFCFLPTQVSNSLSFKTFSPPFPSSSLSKPSLLFLLLLLLLLLEINGTHFERKSRASTAKATKLQRNESRTN